MRAFAPALLLLIGLGSMPAFAELDTPVAGQEVRPPIDVRQLPAGHWRTDGRGALSLRLHPDADGQLQLLENTPPLLPQVQVSFVERNEERTMLQIVTQYPHALKFDLHISPDDQTYYYTSSCPLDAGAGHTFEVWPYGVTWVAISAPRPILADEDKVCR